MNTALTPVTDDGAAVLERVIALGDLSKLDPNERVTYYRAVCLSVGLNPLTKPLDYITLNGKLTLYANKGATDQIRRNRGVSIDRVEREVVEGIYVVTVYGHDATGRVDSDMGTVPIRGLSGDNLANAMLKGLTKAKRRLTLSLCGLGMLDELEVATIPNAMPVDVDPETGEIHRQIRTVGRTTEPPALTDGDIASLAPQAVPEPLGLDDPMLFTEQANPIDHEANPDALTGAEIRRLMDKAGITVAQAAAKMTELWPDHNPRRELTARQRGELAIALGLIA